MSTVKFQYEGTTTVIQCMKGDKMIDICKKFSSKTNLNLNKLYFLYGGRKINLDSTFQEIANSQDISRNEMNVLAYETNVIEGLICPKCGNSFYFNTTIIDDLKNSHSNQINILNGLKGQIANIIKDINSHKETNIIISQLDNIIIMIEHIINNIKKNTEEIIKLNNSINKYNTPIDNSINKSSKSNSPIDNSIIKCNTPIDIYKKIIPDPSGETWGSYIMNSLINCQNDSNIYKNVLTKAAIIGKNNKEWARTDNFKIKKDEIDNLNTIFKENINLNMEKKINIDEKEYQIINYKNKFSIDIKNGDYGGTIATSNQAFIFGFFNSKVKCTINEVEKTQCMDICRKVVESLAETFKSLNY